ncbi:hypothetical protein ACH4VR_29125 [Streptomyces sp. NPDC020883]|uniref:hypothetical protein n=1 Tax=Streptomyces sp. NPDC020883 TaxID=3365099 RepID=UPI0037A1EA8D
MPAAHPTPPPPQLPPPNAPAAAIIAPHSETSSLLRKAHSQGWNCITVSLPPHALPLTLAQDPPTIDTAQSLTHKSMRRTAKALRAHGIRAVIPGSPLSIALALSDQLAQELHLPGNDPETSQLRCDRGAQAAALTQAGVVAPRSLRTTNLSDALRWAHLCRLPAYVIAPASTAASGLARTARTDEEISRAWRQLRRTAHHRTGGRNLVIQEALPGPQYILHSITSPDEDRPRHTITEIWSSQTRTIPLGRPVAQGELIARTLSRYARQVLDVLEVEAGALRSRIVCAPGQGPTLLSARVHPAHSLRHTTAPPADAARCSFRTRTQRHTCRTDRPPLELFAGGLR